MQVFRPSLNFVAPSPTILKKKMLSEISMVERKQLNKINFRCFSSGCFLSANHTNYNPFNNFIVTSNISSNVVSEENPLYVYLNRNEMYTPVLNNRIISHIPMGCVYGVFIDVMYDYQSFSLTEQPFGFNFYSVNNIDYISNAIYYTLQEHFKVSYLRNESLLYIQITFKDVF